MRQDLAEGAYMPRLGYGRILCPKPNCWYVTVVLFGRRWTARFRFYA